MGSVSIKLTTANITAATLRSQTPDAAVWSCKKHGHDLQGQSEISDQGHKVCST